MRRFKQKIIKTEIPGVEFIGSSQPNINLDDTPCNYDLYLYIHTDLNTAELSQKIHNEFKDLKHPLSKHGFTFESIFYSDGNDLYFITQKEKYKVTYAVGGLYYLGVADYYISSGTYEWLLSQFKSNPNINYIILLDIVDGESALTILDSRCWGYYWDNYIAQ